MRGIAGGYGVMHQNTVCALAGIFRGCEYTSHGGNTFLRGCGVDLVLPTLMIPRMRPIGGAVTCRGAAVSWSSRTQKCVTQSAFIN